MSPRSSTKCESCGQPLPRKKGEKGRTSDHKGVHRRVDGVWVGVVELPRRGSTRRRKFVYGDTEAAAVRKRAALLTELTIHGDIHTDTMTFKVWIEYWLEQVARKQVAPGTYKSYRNNARRHLIPYFGDTTKLDKIGTTQVRALEKHLTASTPKGAGLSPATAAIVFATLRRTLRDAVREGRIPTNPCTLVEPPRVPTHHAEALTPEEAIRVLEAAAHHRYGAAIAVSLLTGARSGEVRGLTVDRVTDHLDFSWQVQTLTVGDDDKPIVPRDYENRRITSRYYFTRPKSKAGWRIVPLVEPLRSILERHIATMKENKSGLLFMGPQGGPLPSNALSTAWKELLHEAGITRHVVLHGARHTVVDLLYLAGIPEDLIQEIVGHSTRSMTRAYKSKGNTARLTEAMERMSAPFQALTRPGDATSPAGSA